MLKRAAARSKATLSSVVENNNTTTTTTTSNTKKQVFTSPKSVFHATDPNSIPSDELIERVRLKIANAHIFKLPPKPDSGGWRGAGKFMIFSVHDGLCNSSVLTKVCLTLFRLPSRLAR